MNGEQKITINPIMAVLVAIQVIFVIFAVISFQELSKPDEPVLNVNVAGLSQDIEGLPEDANHDIEYSVYQAVAKNTSQSNSVQKTGVNIREGSLIREHFEATDVDYVSFIADVPEVQQSYRVSYVWADNPNNSYVSTDYKAVTFCLPKDQLIYGDFNCKEEKSYIKTELVNNLAKGYDNYMPGYDDLMILPVGSLADENLKLRLSYMTCVSQCDCVRVDQSKIDQAVDAFSDFVGQFGFSLEEIPYYFDNCG